MEKFTVATLQVLDFQILHNTIINYIKKFGGQKFGENTFGHFFDGLIFFENFNII